MKKEGKKEMKKKNFKAIAAKLETDIKSELNRLYESSKELGLLKDSAQERVDKLDKKIEVLSLRGRATIKLISPISTRLAKEIEEDSGDFFKTYDHQPRVTTAGGRESVLDTGVLDTGVFECEDDEDVEDDETSEDMSLDRSKPWGFLAEEIVPEQMAIKRGKG